MLQDFECNVSHTAGNVSRLLRSILTFCTVRYQAVWLYRLSSRAGAIRPAFGYLIKQLNQVLTGADISWQADIGPNLILFHPSGVVIGPGVVIGSDCHIQQGVTLGGSGKVRDESVFPKLGRNIYLGAGCRVLGGVVIGNRVTVGANAVVLSDISDDSTAVGVPAVARSRHGR